MSDRFVLKLERYMKIMNTNYKPIIVLFCLIFAILSSNFCSATNVDNEGPDGVIIDSVVVQNGDIFDLNLPENKNWIFRLANKLHVNTRKHVIKREMLLREGDIFSGKLAEESERNLRTLPYLWDARIEMIKSDSGLNVMSISTSDRWTLAGGPTFSRSSGQTIYQFGFEELNFLGYGQRVSFDYFLREFEENYIRASFYERRLFGSRFGLNSYYNGDPEIGSISLGLAKPLFSLNSKFGYGISYTDINRIDKYYSSGKEFARNGYESRSLGLSAAYRFGTYQNKVSIGLTYNYKDIKISDRLIRPDTSFSFPVDSIYSNYSFSLSASNFEFIKTKRINRISRFEDISLGTEVGISSGFTIDAITNRRLYRTMSISCGYSDKFGSNLVFLTFYRTFWYDGGIDYRKMTNLSIRYYNRTISWLTPTVIMQYAEDWRRDGQNALYLGENSGLRGYPRYFAEGEKLLRVNIENRFFTGVKMLSAEFGVTQFFDFGQTWSDGERFELKQNLWSIGVGIRIGTERVSNAEMIRIDMAYAGKTNNWQISFGVGQYL